MSQPDLKLNADVKVDAPTGWAKVILQLGSAGVVCLLLVWAWTDSVGFMREIRDDHREDVKQFRDELKQFRQDAAERNKAQWERVREVTDALNKLAARLGAAAAPKADEPPAAGGP